MDDIASKTSVFFLLFNNSTTAGTQQFFIIPRHQYVNQAIRIWYTE